MTLRGAKLLPQIIGLARANKRTCFDRASSTMSIVQADANGKTGGMPKPQTNCELGQESGTQVPARGCLVHLVSALTIHSILSQSSPRCHGSTSHGLSYGPTTG